MKRFDGPDLTQEDHTRLDRQFDVIFNLMKDGTARTLEHIAYLTNYPQASISAQLRHMRKERFGGHNVIRVHKGNGLYEYTLITKAKA